MEKKTILISTLISMKINNYKLKKKKVAVLKGVIIQMKKKYIDTMTKNFLYLVMFI